MTTLEILGKLRINRLRLNSESFGPAVQFEKWEIHPVFRHFPNFRLSQNLSLSALADLIRASLGLLNLLAVAVFGVINALKK